MTVRDAMSRGYNLVGTALVAIPGFAFFPEFFTEDDVSRHAQAILERLANGTMPCDGKWPEEQIALFRVWVEAGMRA